MRHQQALILILCGSIPATALACRGGSDGTGGGGSGGAVSSTHATTKASTGTGTGTGTTTSTQTSTGTFGTSSTGNGGAGGTGGGGGAGGTGTTASTTASSTASTTVSTTVSTTASTTAATTTSSTSATTTSTTASTSTGMMGGGATFVVVHIGDGTAVANAGEAQAVFLEERQLDGTLVVAANNPLPLPTAVLGSNRILTLSGNSTSEGALSLSGDGQFLTVAGYDAAVGTPAVNGTTNTAVNRIVARVNSAGAIDTTTRIDNAYNQGNIRGAATVDGTEFWLTGSSGGVRHATLATTGSTSIETTPTSTRGINVFGGQLFATSGSGTTRNVFKVGMGTPTMTGQAATSLYANPAATSSPYGFAMVDHNPNVAGLDTMYVADDQASMNGGGISKWTFDGTTWTAGPVFNDGLGATVGARGVAAIVTGNDVTVIATSSDATLNRILVYVDTFSATPPTGAVVATAAANTIFRGVAPASQ